MRTEKKIYACIIAFILFLLNNCYAQVAGTIIHTPTDTLWKVHVIPGMPYDDDPSDDLLILRSQYVLSYCPQKKNRFF